MIMPGTEFGRHLVEGLCTISAAYRAPTSSALHEVASKSEDVVAAVFELGAAHPDAHEGVFKIASDGIMRVQ